MNEGSSLSPSSTSSTSQEERRGKTMWRDGYKLIPTNITYLFAFLFLLFIYQEFKIGFARKMYKSTMPMTR
jgi:hypothetical protein